MEAPLNVRLAAYTDRLRELNFPFAEAYDDLVARLYAGEVGTRAPEIGEIMPSFALPTRDGKIVCLEELVERGPLVVSFNRGHWCPFCKIELRTIAKFHRDIGALGAQVISIMPDRQKYLDDLRELTTDVITMLTDVDNGYALSLGLVIWVGETLKALMQGRGYELSTYQGNDGWFLPIPATFVLNRQGRIVARNIDPDFRRRMEVDEIIAALELTSVGQSATTR